MKHNIRFAEVPPRPASDGWRERRLRHPFFAWTRFRPPLAQHTAAEHHALEKHARGKRSVLEIGVAEGASGVALRSAMDPSGTLYLVDPFHLSRIKPLNFLKRAARSAIGGGPGARTVWLESFSQDAARDWRTPLDFLLIDGDHREAAVAQDWHDWQPHVIPGGIVAFHDARLFPHGWTSPDYGPLRFVDRFFRHANTAPWAIVDEVDSLVFVGKRG